MCGIYGLIRGTGAQAPATLTAEIMRRLAIEAMSRGKHATGCAYITTDNICIEKAAKPATEFIFNVPKQAHFITGHTRHATSGNPEENKNNHPFINPANTFTITHNGYFYNYDDLHRLPNPEGIETDSYIIIQNIEALGGLNDKSVIATAEKLNGIFTFTAADRDKMYIVKQDNPVYILYFPVADIYIYGSTKEIVCNAISDLMNLDEAEEIPLLCGEILKIDRNGNRSILYFDADSVYNDDLMYYDDFEEYQYILDICGMFGLTEDDIYYLVESGYTPEEIEDILYQTEPEKELYIL